MPALTFANIVRRSVLARLLLMLSAASCSQYPCPQDLTEDTMTGQVSVPSAAGSVTQRANGNFGLSDVYDDHNTVLDIQIATPIGDVLVSFRRPATTGTSRFEDLVSQQWICPPEAPYTQYGSPTPSCSGEGGVIPGQLLALKGTVEMLDDAVVASDTFDLTAHLRLTNVMPPLMIDVVAHHRHATIGPDLRARPDQHPVVRTETCAAGHAQPVGVAYFERNRS